MVRVPRHTELHAPEFPKDLEWVGAAFIRIDQLARRAVPLVEFLDSARINSLRTLPYLRAWHERYADAGLRVIGVHCPGYSFGRDPGVARAAVEELDLPYPVVLDPQFLVWRAYGTRGWPARFLFGHDLKLRYAHYGEGDYADCELAIQEALAELGSEGPFPDPLEPVRPEDAPGVLLDPQTADVSLPAERDRLGLEGEWRDGPDFIESASPGAVARVHYSGGGAWAVVSGEGAAAPGLREARDGTVSAERPGLRLHGFQFTPRPPS